MKSNINTHLKEMEELDAIATVYNDNPYYKAPGKILTEIKNMFE